MKYVLNALMAGFLLSGAPLLHTPALAQSSYEPPTSALRGEVNGTRIALYAPYGSPIGNFISLVYFDSDGREWRSLWTSDPVLGEAEFAAVIAAAGGPSGFVRKNMNAINEALAKKFPGAAARANQPKSQPKSTAEELTREAGEKFKFQVAPDGTVKLAPK